MNNSNKPRKNRGMPSGHPSNRPSNRSRGSIDQKIFNDGVYGNPRLMHAATSLIGCVVEVQVKNEGIYQGIFRTFSPKMSIVLEMAHRLDDTNNQKQIPSKDRLVEKIIFNLADIVFLEAKNVELDYANKDLIKSIDYEPVGRVSKGRYIRTVGANHPLGMDSGPPSYGLGRLRRGCGNPRTYSNAFTDSAISSKYNGQLGERQLEPWSGDDAELLGSGSYTGGSLTNDSIENESANGWDANEMFKTNAEKFNINSLYDPSLSQYTTQLQPQDTKEYKKREAEALKIASEIEKSDSYRARIDLENGDGDEEDKFSAVLRPGESRGNDSNSISGKYVPPHQRRNPNQGRALRVSNNVNNSVPTSPQSPKPPAQVTEETTDIKVNGEKEILKTSALENGSPEIKSNNVNSQEIKDEAASGDVLSTTPSKLDRKSSNPKTRDSQIAEFKEFSTNFKLSENEAKEKKVEKPADPSTSTEKSMESSSEQQREEAVNKSKLNPNAKEFVFNPNAKPFQPKQPSNQISTPPRVHTQSPLNPLTAMQPPHLYQPYMISAPMPHQNVQQTQRLHTKRAVVSVQPRPEFNPAAQAAAATGQPLLAAQGSLPSQHGQYPQIQYMQQPMVNPGAALPNMYSQTMVQVPGPRMMTPQSVVPVNHVASHPGTEGSQPPSGQPPTPGTGPAPAGTVFVSPQPGAQAVPAHMNPPHQQHPHAPVPAHMAPHHQPTPHSQPSHMSAQPAGHHTAPSPVHQHQHSAAPNHPAAPMQQQPPPHPPSSGTPQPQIIYQPQGQMAGPQAGSVAMPQHPPPLQPSPHTPTSPQTMQPPTMTFPYTPYNTQMQGVHPSQQQITFAHSHPHPTTQAQQQQHAHSPQTQQIIMMPGISQPSNHGNATAAAHHAQMPQGHQFQGHHIHGHAAGQTAHMVPPNAISVSSASSSYPYVPHPAGPHQIVYRPSWRP